MFYIKFCRMTDLGINACMCLGLNNICQHHIGCLYFRNLVADASFTVTKTLASTCSKFCECASAHTFPYVRTAEAAPCSSWWNSSASLQNFVINYHQAKKTQQYIRGTTFHLNNPQCKWILLMTSFSHHLNSCCILSLSDYWIYTRHQVYQNTFYTCTSWIKYWDSLSSVKYFSRHRTAKARTIGSG